MVALVLPPPRVAFTNPDGTLTPEAYRTLQVLVDRTGGAIGNSGGDTFVTSQDFGAIESQQSAGGDISSDVMAAMDVPAVSEALYQPQAGEQPFAEMVMQPESSAMTAPESVTVGASPYTHTSKRHGYILVAGGTVSQIAYIRRGVATVTGAIAGMFPILLGDSIRVTYTVAPTITFIPR